MSRFWLTNIQNILKRVKEIVRSFIKIYNAFINGYISAHWVLLMFPFRASLASLATLLLLLLEPTEL